jgi:hypothetical protein
VKALLTITMLAVLLSVGTAYAEPSASTLPDAPAAQAHRVPVFHVVDWTLAGSIATARFLDWTSTEECGRRPYGQCHEANLPNALVHNAPAFALYEAGTASLEIWGQYELTKLGHRKLARTLQAVNLSYMGKIVGHNYVLDTTAYKAVR